MAERYSSAVAGFCSSTSAWEDTARLLLSPSRIQSSVGLTDDDGNDDEDKEGDGGEEAASALLLIERLSSTKDRTPSSPFWLMPKGDVVDDKNDIDG